MNRDELIEAMQRWITKQTDGGRPSHTLFAEAAWRALSDEGGSHILMKDGTAVPLDGGEAVKDVTALGLRKGVIEVSPGFQEAILIDFETDETVAVPNYGGEWDIDLYYVPLNTPSKPNQEDSAVVALSETKEHEES